MSRPWVADHWTWPHGSVVVGRSAVTLFAAGLRRAGSMRFPTNGAPRLICLPPLHAGEAIVVKSPASIWAVGTYEMLLVGTWRRMVPLEPAKKKSLSWTIGPPSVPPN